jgi:predicted Zn-dependent peptidase
MEDIQTWTIDDIKNFHATYYQPKNAVIVVAGDITVDEVFKAAKEKFEKIKNTHDIPTVVRAEPVQDGPRRAVVYKETQTEILAIAYKIPPFDHEDQTAIGALCELLSTGKSSRLYETLVEKKQLANGLHVYNADQIDQGLLIILAMANPGVKAEDIEVEIHKELDKLIKNGVRPDELEKLKLNAKSDFIFALESSSSVADLYGSFLVRGNTAPLMNYMESLNKLDNEKLKAVAKKTFDPTQSTTLLLRKGQK